MNYTVYEYESLIYAAGETGGAYVIFPMISGKNSDGSVCYIIGVRKEIRSRIGKQPGDCVRVTVRERK